MQPILDAVNRIPTSYSRDISDSELSETETAIAELCLSFLELQMASLPRSSGLSSSTSPVDAWTDLVSPLNEAAFTWCLNQAEHWRHSTRISRSTDLATLEAPLSEQLQLSLGDRKFLRKFQPPTGKFGAQVTDTADVFDDTLFYAALLRDALNTASAGVRSMNKPRTVAAFRAAKGRRLSAKVIDKLVGFVHPTAEAGGAAVVDMDILMQSLFQ